MSIIPTTRQHLIDVKVPDWDEPEREQVVDMVCALPDIDILLAEYGRTLVMEGRAVASYGVWPVWAGVGRAWSMISEEARLRYPLSLYRGVKRNLEAVEERDRLGRIEATVRWGHPTAHSWIQHLGFRHEGVMRNYGIGGVGDSHLYARTRTWPL